MEHVIETKDSLHNIGIILLDKCDDDDDDDDNNNKH